MHLYQHKALIAVLSVGLAVAIAHDAEAQRRGRGMRFGAFGGTTSRVELATLDSVQSALNMTDEQKKFAASLNDQMREDQRAARRDGDFASRREEREKIQSEASAKLAEELDEAQQKRLTGIFAQVNGASSLTDEQIHSDLSISAEQDEQLTEIREATGEAMRDAFQDFRDMTDEERQEAGEEVQKLRTDGDEKMLAVLTDAQKSTFAELKGEQVDVDLSQLRGRFGGGGRRGGGDR